MGRLGIAVGIARPLWPGMHVTLTAWALFCRLLCRRAPVLCFASVQSIEAFRLATFYRSSPVVALSGGMLLESGAVHVVGIPSWIIRNLCTPLFVDCL